ncbi:MAG: T9SS type A sorting domain-containing protein [Bacteroidetes bacterium]|nr:T9SS type A sorting domain-containing protein [Bacteroidota bacterium]
MKKLYTLLFFCFSLQFLFSQTDLDSIAMIPANPTNNDDVKFVLYITKSSAPCTGWTNSFIKTNNHFDITDCIYIDPLGLGLPVICNTTDTVNIGMQAPGSYTYQVVLRQTGQVGCVSSFMLDTSAVLNFTVGAFNSISEESLSNAIRLYPNPATSDELVISVNNKLVGKNSNLVFYSMLGKEIQRVNISSTSGRIKINTSHFANGIYLYRIEDNDLKGKINRLIVSK